MNFGTTPTPPQLFRQFERGDLSREELQAFMAIHARGLIEEMVEERKNPVAGYLERLRNRAHAKKHVKKYGAPLFREILIALGQIEDFPPAQILWNAGHTDVPLHCYIRSRLEPVFRIPELKVEPMTVSLKVEYGAHASNKTTKETILFQRDALLKLNLLDRIILD